jgi:hypothetical protein
MTHADFENRLAEIEEAAKAATPGPWEHIHVYDGEEVLCGPQDGFTKDVIGHLRLEVNGRYLATANPSTVLAMSQALRVAVRTLELIIGDKWARTSSSSGELCKNLEGNCGSLTVGEVCKEGRAQAYALMEKK